MNNYLTAMMEAVPENKVDEGCDTLINGTAPAIAPRQPSSDHEGEMARSQLQQAAEASASLMSLIQDGENLPAGASEAHKGIRLSGLCSTLHGV